jgi:hypothetical protein
LPFVKAAAVFVGDGLVLMVDHDIQQMDNSGQFAGVELAEQFMGFGFERVNGHCVLLRCCCGAA